MWGVYLQIAQWRTVWSPLMFFGYRYFKNILLFFIYFLHLRAFFFFYRISLRSNFWFNLFLIQISSFLLYNFHFINLWCILNRLFNWFLSNLGIICFYISYCLSILFCLFLSLFLLFYRFLLLNYLLWFLRFFWLSGSSLNSRRSSLRLHLL
jgi:hypothetical protein